MKKFPPFYLALVCSALSCASLRAQVIISDTFTGTDGTALANHSPDVNTPGRPYQTPQENFQPLDVISGNTSTASASAVSLLFNSGGGNPPPAPTGDVTLSLDIKIGSLVGADNQRGIFLGFFTPNGDLNPDNGSFQGIVVSPTGSLLERVFNTYTPLGAAPAGFSVNNFENLTYSLNMSTGIISNIAFGGQTYTPTTDNILASGTPIAIGFYSASGAAGTQGFVDNLVYENGIVGPIPEPSTWAAMFGSLALLGGVQRLRRARQA